MSSIWFEAQCFGIKNVWNGMYKFQLKPHLGLCYIGQRRHVSLWWLNIYFSVSYPTKRCWNILKYDVHNWRPYSYTTTKAKSICVDCAKVKVSHESETITK